MRKASIAGAVIGLITPFLYPLVNDALGAGHKSETWFWMWPTSVLLFPLVGAHPSGVELAIAVSSAIILNAFWFSVVAMLLVSASAWLIDRDPLLGRGMSRDRRPSPRLEIGLAKGRRTDVRHSAC